MGFVNQWTLGNDWNDQEWKLIKAHAAGLLSVGADVVKSRKSDPYEGGKCRRDEVIGFSGMGKDGEEDFRIYQREFSFPYEGGAGAVAEEYKQKNGVSFAFCKTNRSPMQKYVWAMLVFMHQLNPYKIGISNDDGEIKGMWKHFPDIYPTGYYSKEV